ARVNNHETKAGDGGDGPPLRFRPTTQSDEAGYIAQLVRFFEETGRHASVGDRLPERDGRRLRSPFDRWLGLVRPCAGCGVPRDLNMFDLEAGDSTQLSGDCVVCVVRRRDEED